MVVFAALNCFAATKIMINPATIVMYPNKVGSSIENLKISFVKNITNKNTIVTIGGGCLLYTSPSPRDAHESRMPSSA